MEPNQDTLRQILSGGMTQSELTNRSGRLSSITGLEDMPEGGIKEFLEIIGVMAESIGLIDILGPKAHDAIDSLIEGEDSGIGHLLQSPFTASPDTMYMPEDLNRMDRINPGTMTESGLRNLLLGRDIR